MYHKAQNFLPVFLFFIGIFAIIHNNVHAQTNDKPHAQQITKTMAGKIIKDGGHIDPIPAIKAPESCKAQDRTCLIDALIKETALIDNEQWRDQTYREIAKTLAFDKAFDKAVSIIGLIKTADTKAMTIRGIGMALAAHDEKPESLTKKFATLRLKADEIEHPPSRGIALTYIAMAQAFAGDNEGAWKTTMAMKNQALKNKAYGETAEIQAEKGNFKATKTSISKIEDLSFRNKAYGVVSKILSDSTLYDDALSAANAITNSYKKSQALQYLLDKQKPRERLKGTTTK